MPQSTDTQRLHQSLEDYATLQLEGDVSGSLKFSRAEDDQYAMICREIEQTRLPRRLSFASDGHVCLDILARNGRVFLLFPSRGQGEPKVFTEGSPEDAMCFYDMVNRALIKSKALTLSISRALTEIDPAASGISVGSLRAVQTKESTSLQGQNHNGFSTEVLLYRCEVRTTYGENDQTSRLNTALDDCSDDIKQWLEMLNDQTFDEIVFHTEHEKELTLTFCREGVRVRV